MVFIYDKNSNTRKQYIDTHNINEIQNDYTK